MTDLTQPRRPTFLGRHKCAALVVTTLIAITLGTIGFVDAGYIQRIRLLSRRSSCGVGPP